MKKLLIALLLCLSYSITAQIKNTANRSKFPDAVLQQFDKIEKKRSKRAVSSAEVASLIDKELIPVDAENRLLLSIRVTTKNILDQLRTMGCEITGGGNDEYNIFVPYVKIDEVASLQEIRHVWYAPRHFTRDEVIGAGTGIHNGIKTADFFGLAGNNVKVGVVSNIRWNCCSVNGF